MTSQWFHQADMGNPGLVPCWRNYHYTLPERNAGLCLWVQFSMDGWVPPAGTQFAVLINAAGRFVVQWQWEDGLDKIIFFYRDSGGIYVFSERKLAPNIRDGKPHWIACWFDNLGNGYIRIDTSVSVYPYTPINNCTDPVYFISGVYGGGVPGYGVYLDDVRLFFDATNWNPDAVYAGGAGVQCTETWFTATMSCDGWFCGFDETDTGVAVVGGYPIYDYNTAYSELVDGGVPFEVPLPPKTVSPHTLRTMFRTQWTGGVFQQG